MSTTCRGWLPLTMALVLTLPPVTGMADPGGQAEHVVDTEVLTVADMPLYSGRLLAEFYRERDHRNAWDQSKAKALLELAEGSISHGLAPADFHAEAIRALLEEGALDSNDGDARTRADIVLSDGLLRYLHHLQYGKYNPRHINRGQNFVDPADAEDLKAEMHAALAAPDLAEAVTALLPRVPFYDNLKRGYERYLNIADAGSWETIPGGPSLNRGARDPRVPLIRARLAVIDGDASPTPPDPKLYDADLVEAIKGFQGRAGLAQDGVVGPNTLRALNHPLDERLAMIRANLERMRWLYHELPPDYVFVDITAFRVDVMRDHQPVWGTRTVVGTVEDQTPMFRDEMEHLVFNPTWSVPQSIQQKMGRVGSKYHVIDRRTGRRVSASDVSDTSRYRVVQPAGPGNALGRVKFMFPNGHAIYLHDTPSRHLFARSTRAYSHGCVRVQEPLELARQVLNKPNWDEAAIDRVVKRGSTRYVNLDDHLPVLIYYLTALADDDGRVGFRRDIYQRDQPLFAVLDDPAHAARIAFREPEPEEGAAAVAEAPPASPVEAPVQSNGAETTASADQSEPALPPTAAHLSATEPSARSTDGPQPGAAGQVVAAEDEAQLAAQSVAEPSSATGEPELATASQPEAGGVTAGAATAQAAEDLSTSPVDAGRLAASLPPSSTATDAQTQSTSASRVAADRSADSSILSDEEMSEQAADRTRATVAEPVPLVPTMPSRPFIDQELFGPAVNLKPLLPGSFGPQG
jgi:murein L,D-transpeptidase YcbB/YkuD